jgi:response regulator RpfG family c-di-GMP phosphodiesterase
LDIPITARNSNVVDVWDVLNSVGTYRTAWNKNEANKNLLDRRGFHFEPRGVVEVITMLESGVARYLTN